MVGAIWKMGAAFCVAASLSLPSALAQDATYPSRTVRMVVASTPGSSMDIHARILSDALSARWHQPVVLEFKPGGSMMIGAAFTANAPPDGYTLFFSIDTPFVVNPLMFKDMSYKVSDFTPISLWSDNPFVLVVNSEVPVKDLKGLITLLRNNPGKFHASSASATTLLTHELMKSLANVEYNVITYKGGAEAMASTAAGETHFAFYDIGNASSMIRNGKVRILAQTPPKRSEVIADVPTLAEAGVPGFEGGTWGAVFGPAKMPKDIVAKINADVRAIVADPQIAARLKALGVEPRASSPQELEDKIATSTARWQKLIAERNIKLQ
jgi:tripartite-type tricarboxylate transporter receptor subunit TctC